MISIPFSFPDEKTKMEFNAYAIELVLKRFKEEFPDNKKPEQALRATMAYLNHPDKENGFNHLDLDRWIPSEISDHEFKWAAARAAAFMPYAPMIGERYAFYAMLDEEKTKLNDWLKERKLV